MSTKVGSSSTSKKRSTNSDFVDDGLNSVEQLASEMAQSAKSHTEAMTNHFKVFAKKVGKLESWNGKLKKRVKEQREKMERMENQLKQLEKDKEEQKKQMEWKMAQKDKQVKEQARKLQEMAILKRRVEELEKNAEKVSSNLAERPVICENMIESEWHADQETARSGKATKRRVERGEEVEENVVKQRKIKEEEEEEQKMAQIAYYARLIDVPNVAHLERNYNRELLLQLIQHGNDITKSIYIQRNQGLIDVKIIQSIVDLLASAEKPEEFVGEVIVEANVRLLIGGDGPKRVELEEMRERHKLLARVLLLGALPHDKVRDLLVQGQIFLNTSLTEAFCMAIVEAACCGFATSLACQSPLTPSLHIVSTRVGGIPEVLPPEFVSLVEPDPEEISQALLLAIQWREQGQFTCPMEKHRQIARLYHWEDIARRTERVYAQAIGQEGTKPGQRLKNYLNAGFWFGLVWAWGSALNLLMAALLDWLDPREAIGKAD